MEWDVSITRWPGAHVGHGGDPFRPSSLGRSPRRLRAGDAQKNDVPLCYTHGTQASERAPVNLPCGAAHGDWIVCFQEPDRVASLISPNQVHTSGMAARLYIARVSILPGEDSARRESLTFKLGADEGKKTDGSAPRTAGRGRATQEQTIFHRPEKPRQTMFTSRRRVSADAFFDSQSR